MSVLEPVIATCVSPRCTAAADVEAVGIKAKLCPLHGVAFERLYPGGDLSELMAFQDRTGLAQMREDAKAKGLAKAKRARENPLESQLLGQVGRWLDKQPDLRWWRQMVGEFERNGSTVHIGELGEPDLSIEVYVKRPRGTGHVIVPVACRVELKTKDGAVSKPQRRWHERAAARGGLVRVCRSVAEVEAFINQVRKLEGLLQLP